MPISFTPLIVPLSDPEIVNSGRGEYYWLDQPADPVGWPLVDTYHRDQIQWRAVELNPGVYDFTLLESYIFAATKLGGRYSFRIQPFFDQNLVPEIQPSWVPSLPTTNGPAKAPDWNSEGYLSSWGNMIAAVGKQFNGDPRLYYMDISGYGNNGEWFAYSGEYQTDITQASAQRICDAAINAFPDTYMLAPAMDPGFTYAQHTSKRVGSRFDFLGGMELTYQGLDDVIKNQWKYAPLVTEWNADINSFSVSRGLNNIRDMRVSLLSSGNKATKYAAMSAADQAMFLTANKISGFRYSLTSLQMSTNLAAGQSVSVTTSWRNDGVSPIYDPRYVQLVLIAANGARWTLGLSDELRFVLGTETPTMQFTTQIIIPDSVPRGTYTVAIKVVDPTGYLPPLALANAGRDAYGAYPIGSVTVAASKAGAQAISPLQTPVITSSSTMTYLGAITGTSSPNATVKVFINRKPHFTTANATGAWSVAPTNYSATGLTYAIEAMTVDQNGHTSVPAIQSVAVHGATLARDSFDRSDSQSIGVADVGGAWTTHSGTWTIAAGKLKPTSQGDNYVTLDVGTNNVIVGADITGMSTGKWLGLVARYVDSENYYTIETNEASGVITIFKKSAGTSVYLGQCNLASFTTLAMKIRTITDGVLVIVIADGIVIGSAIDVTAPFVNGARAGIHFGGFDTNYPTFNNFYCEKVA